MAEVVSSLKIINVVAKTIFVCLESVKHVFEHVISTEENEGNESNIYK